MIGSYKLKIIWDLFRAHLCTVAVAVSFQTTWRNPREAFRHGGLQYAMIFTILIIVVALPLILLQLAIGQLSQQDPIGVWRAVPFFKGVGYMRLLISFLAAVYTVIYLSLTIAYFLYSLTNSLPFWECIDLDFEEDDLVQSLNASACLDESFMAPVPEKPEYYLAEALIVLVLWIILPFIFYNPVKLMRRIMYVFGPLIILLMIIISSCIGNSLSLSHFIPMGEWKTFVEPDIWYGAMIQVLLSSQVAGGYLISSGDTIYSNTNVKWTAVVIVVINLASTWITLLFWYSISGQEKDTTVFAILLSTYSISDDPNITIVWPLIIFLMLFFSGFITLLTFLFPIYDRCRRIGGLRWRVVSAGGSLLGAAISSGILAVREPGLTMLDDFTVPMLISIVTILEICGFVFIYGWKILVEDIEFLTGSKLGKFWVWGWCSGPGVIVVFTIWWVTIVYLRNDDWFQPPWPGVAIVTTAVVALVVFLTVSSIVVARQVQYDLIGKLKSSFRPSRHWGPRDPITHYYWLERREEHERGDVGRMRYNRRQLGQFSGRPSFLTLSETITKNDISLEVDKTRSNSDDWLYTVYRKQEQNNAENDIKTRKRARSLDWAYIKKSNNIIHFNKFDCLSVPDQEQNNNNNTIPAVKVDTR